MLHRSEANLSDKPRWSLISVYNRDSNIPYNERSSSSTMPLQPVPDEALMKWVADHIDDGANLGTRAGRAAFKDYPTMNLVVGRINCFFKIILYERCFGSDSKTLIKWCKVTIPHDAIVAGRHQWWMGCKGTLR
ncbi:hypothetical protein [Niabella hibiscisoli]|uniref:hypothetical protein n=1 Tax=Niabella hibiscisoli TaxID=1825928 RepID=UPI00374CED3F